MAKTLIDIPEKLLERAMELSGCPTKKATVVAALELLVEQKERESILELKGKLHWEGDLEQMRTRPDSCVTG